jgi:Cof subfamily protein (haloacid dehalogenase superfamily)
MDKPSIKLVAIDLDGTLLDPEGHLSEENAEAIRRATEAGVGVVIATGKSRGSAERLLQELALESHGVFNQGLVIYNAAGDIIQQTALEDSVVQGILNFAREHDLPYFTYSGQYIVTPFESEFRQLLHDHYHEPMPVIEEWDPGASRPVNKIIVIDPDDDGSMDGEVRARLEELCEGQAHITQAVRYFVEVLPAGTSKGAGLRWLLEKLNIAPEEVMAIGDGENDVEMLQMVGIAVAMGNAHARVKEVADAVVSSNAQSGVAQAIERFVL